MGKSSNLYINNRATKNSSFNCRAKTVDINLMREASKMFEGVHDFRTFKGKTDDESKSTIREIERIEIIENTMTDIGISKKFSWPQNLLGNLDSDVYTFVDIYFKGKGFLYKQVHKAKLNL